VLRADPNRLAQALRNLIANAIQHTGPGGLVRVTAEASGDAVVIAVEDDGPGISEQEREVIFNRFHRTDRSRTRSAGGTGLGLAIVRAIVDAHHGHAAAEKAPGGGARLVLVLPGYSAVRGAAREPITERSRDG
jgi:signal transduction histidine kinase